MQHPSNQTNPEPQGDPATLSNLLAPLMRYARSRLHNVALAEDAVSETLLVGIESGRSFATPAQHVAWMYGVLRHKLVDQLRQQGRETPSGDLVADGAVTDPGGLNPLGAWPCAGDTLSGPEQACSQRQLMERVGRNCDTLPSLQRQAFVMRELFDLEPEGICHTLGVSKGHLWVLVHRARQRLRQSLPDAAPAPHKPAARRAPARAGVTLVSQSLSGPASAQIPAEGPECRTGP